MVSQMEFSAEKSAPPKMKKPLHISSLFIKNSPLFKSLILSIFIGSQVQAGEVIKAFVDKQDGHYLVDLVMQIDAPKGKVYQLITDYSHLAQLSESIQSSQIIKQAIAGTTQVKLVSESCVLFFCQIITQVQNVHELDNGYIHINVEPTLSDLKLNTQLWHIETLDNNRTHIRYSADIVPNFWIPPLIGSWIFQSRLLEEATNLIYNMEKIATSTRITDQFQYTQNQDIQVQSTQNQNTPEAQTTEITEDE